MIKKISKYICANIQCLNAFFASLLPCTRVCSVMNKHYSLTNRIIIIIKTSIIPHRTNNNKIIPNYIIIETHFMPT